MCQPAENEHFVDAAVAIAFLATCRKSLLKLRGWVSSPRTPFVVGVVLSKVLGRIKLDAGAAWQEFI
jgi:hypothetical protein